MAARQAPLGAILAGGAGRRMGGADKAFLALGGRTLLDHALARLGPMAGEIAISANGDPARFSAYGLPVLTDPPGRSFGPLSGLLQACRHAEARGIAEVLTAPVDTPFFPSDLAAGLAPAPAIAATASGLHPAFGLWRAADADLLERRLGEGLRALRDWAAERGARIAIFPDESAFFNINAPEDLAAAEARLRDVR
jgi:molybdopterin-guanine dinucleotide biosynthesis protein A